MAEGFFRSKKGFTVVQNEITRDTHISLKAKGLYLVIQAYISMPDKKWTKEDFRNLTKEGKKAFDSAWKELKDFGYLKVHFMLRKKPSAMLSPTCHRTVDPHLWQMKNHRLYLPVFLHFSSVQTQPLL